MIARYEAEARREFCCPGHRRGRDVDPEVLNMLGPGAFTCDVTQVPGIDDLLAPCAEIAEAQQLAAATWGARDTWFLTNGSSSGLHAALLATCGPGDIVVLPRASHRSLLGGLILCGATPRWVACDVDPVLGCALPPNEAAMLAAAHGSPPQQPPARLAVFTRPTYYGHVVPLSTVGDFHRCGTMVLVDEAWGAHLGFNTELPPSALQCKADLVVNSTHKMCAALSGGSMLHRGSERCAPERLAAAVRLLTTTSPYYGTLLSLDGARRQMATNGGERVQRALAKARTLREDLAAIRGLQVAGPPDHDELRVAFSAAELGWSGYELEAWLWREARVQVELSDMRAVILLVGLADDAAAVQDVVAAVRCLERRSPLAAVPDPVPLPPMRMTPREAWAREHESVLRSEAAGRVAAEALSVYPPGIPAVVPGEELDADVLTQLQQTLASGGRLQGAADPTLRTIRVVR
jgi:arginine/lysine/ornithine decarboxylase